MVVERLLETSVIKIKKNNMYNSPFFKRMGEFKHSDAPDAKGKFNDLSASV